MSTTVKLAFFSPRWGHDDTYTFELSKEVLKITPSTGIKISICTWQENVNPKWTGESLIRTLQNDAIYPPENFQELVEHAWVAWRNGDLNDQQVKTELEVLATWLNDVTKAKPKSEFWKAYF